jgi:hypothetical protein
MTQEANVRRSSFIIERDDDPSKVTLHFIDPDGTDLYIVLSCVGPGDDSSDVNLLGLAANFIKPHGASIAGFVAEAASKDE